MYSKTILEMPKAMRKALSGGERSDTFAKAMQLQGKAFRDVPGRKTMQININGNSYFIKQHFGVGWGEIVKNLITLKKPILGALTEVAAIQKLDAIGIKTTPLVAYGQRGCNPANLHSFIITQDLGDIVTLEDIFLDDIKLASPETEPNKASGDVDLPSAKISTENLLKATAQLAATLHGAGLCHRDFYLCHFVLKKAELAAGEMKLHLIDLHRMLQGQPPNGSAVMKDMAGLYFSMLQIGLSAQHFDVIKQHYLPQSAAFWAKVEARAQGLLAKFNSQKFQDRLQKDRAKLS